MFGKCCRRNKFNKRGSSGKRRYSNKAVTITIKSIYFCLQGVPFCNLFNTIGMICYPVVQYFPGSNAESK